MLHCTAVVHVPVGNQIAAVPVNPVNGLAAQVCAPLNPLASTMPFNEGSAASAAASFAQASAPENCVASKIAQSPEIVLVVAYTPLQPIEDALMPLEPPPSVI